MLSRARTDRRGAPCIGARFGRGLLGALVQTGVVDGGRIRLCRVAQIAIGSGSPDLIWEFVALVFVLLNRVGPPISALCLQAVGIGVPKPGLGSSPKKTWAVPSAVPGEALSCGGIWRWSARTKRSTRTPADVQCDPFAARGGSVHCFPTSAISLEIRDDTAFRRQGFQPI